MVKRRSCRLWYTRPPRCILGLNCDTCGRYERKKHHKLTKRK